MHDILVVPGLAGEPFLWSSAKLGTPLSDPRPGWGVVLEVSGLAGDPFFWSSAWLGTPFSVLLEPLGGPLARSWGSFEPSEAVLVFL